MEEKRIKVIAFTGDLGGCYLYRLAMPFRELKGHGFDITYYPFIPNCPGKEQFKYLIQIISSFDICIVQRNYVLATVKLIKEACNFSGVPLVYCTDDDYLNIPEKNQAYLSVVPADFWRNNPNPSPEVVAEGVKRGREDYKEIIRICDAVQVSTEELKRLLAPYNKNIHVFENCLEQVWNFKDWNAEESFRGPNGEVNLPVNNNLWLVPCYQHTAEDAIALTPRIGYSGTITHRQVDWPGIEYYWQKLIQKYNKTCWFVYLGDRYFWERHEEFIKGRDMANRNVWIPQSAYELYMFNYRNIDIAIAPLEANVFNMSKSDIKAVEAAAWGIPSVLPNYITYSRNFRHGENCLLYNNGREFQECVEALINDADLRFELGKNAHEYVKNNRLQKHTAGARANFLRSLVDNSYRLRTFIPTIGDSNKNES